MSNNGVVFLFFFAVYLFAAVEGKKNDVSYDSSATTEVINLYLLLHILDSLAI